MFFVFWGGLLGCASFSKQISSTNDDSIPTSESKSKYKGFRCIKDGQVRHKVMTQKGWQYKVTNTSFCINHALYEIISYDCLSKEGCLARNSYKSKDSSIQYNGVGNPNWGSCSKIGGKAQSIEFYDDEWQSVTICLFQDNSFIDLYNGY